MFTSIVIYVVAFANLPESTSLLVPIANFNTRGILPNTYL